MTTQSNKRLVQVFPEQEKEQVNSGMSAGGGGCACGADAGGASINLEEMLAQFLKEYGDKAEIKIADYSTEQAVFEAIESLNTVLETSKESLKATRENLDLIMSQSAPIIAIDGVIVAAKNLPTVEQLAKVITGELDFIPASSGCC